jgi:hypothetical protein
MKDDKLIGDGMFKERETMTKNICIKCLIDAQQ